jgi:MFS family permease
MYGLSRGELRFALVIGSSHFAQHVYYRVLPPLIPVLAVALAYPLWQLGLLITLYSIGMGIAQAPLGVLSDRIDRRYLLPTGLALTGAAYVVFAFAPTLGASLRTVTLLGYAFEGGFLVMSLAMVVVGVGLAVVHPAGYPMITDNVSDSNKGKVLGVFGASSKLGDAAAPAAIAGLILILAWQQIVLLFGVAGVLYGAALYVVFRDDEYETVPSGRRTDDADESAADTGNGDRRTYLYPMVAVYLYFMSSMLSTRGLNTFLPAFLVAVYAYSFDVLGVHVGAESVANVYFALLLVAGAATQLLLGGLADTYDSRLVLLSCMAVAAAGMVAFSLLDLHPLLLGVVVVALGTGLYGVNPARDALISDLSPPDHEGRTFGYIFTAVTLTGAPLPTVIGYVLETVGMRTGFLVLAAGPVLAGACIALLYSDRVYLAGADADASVGTSD